ncbi:hypothetical protein HY469_05290 [Candidatus Roizmanbacteria bacterium]|nr:hypothetical protein [Candidatus Roizmanbacteria bacterium]
MQKHLPAIFVTLSVLLNLVFGWWYLRFTVYQLGYNQALQIANNDLQTMVQQGKLIIPKENEQKVKK